MKGWEVPKAFKFYNYLNINYMVFMVCWIKNERWNKIRNELLFQDFLMISLSWYFLLHKSFWLEIHVRPAQTHINWANVFLQLVWLPYWFIGGRNNETEWMTHTQDGEGPSNGSSSTFCFPVRQTGGKFQLSLRSSSHAYLSLLFFCLGEMWRRTNPMPPLAEGVHFSESR